MKEYIAAKDYKKAKSLIHDGIAIASEKKHPGTDSSWNIYLLDIAYFENVITNIRYFNKLFAFERGIDLKHYQKWKETFNKAEWLIENHIASVIKIKTEEWKNMKSLWKPAQPKLLPYLALIYIEEAYFDRLFGLLKLENSLDIAMSFLKYLKKDYPQELITMYIPLLRDYADRAGDRVAYKPLVLCMKDIIKEIPSGKLKIVA